MIINKELTNEWQFRRAGDTTWLTATVPGCVHTDLLNCNLIPNPFIQKNEQKVTWVEESDWEYLTSFDISSELLSKSNLQLQFDGLDTYADIYLNDKWLQSTDNMFIDWIIPVKDKLKLGKNDIRIYFHSAVKTGLQKLAKIPYTLMAANELAPENQRSNVVTRKAPFHYGWDWGPRLVTCGIYRPIRILAWDDYKINDIYYKPIQITKQKASYQAVIEVEADKASQLNFELYIDAKEQNCKSAFNAIAGKNTFRIAFDINNPEFWWTNGLGGQKLYTVELKLSNGHATIQTVTKRIGVRTLELVQEKDAVGTSFLFKLNGVNVFMKGANYIPSDIFTTRNTSANYKRVVSDAVNANMNMLRIWGGAIYENDELYDLMDENGLLAWNDFMFACNVQPNDNEHLENIRKEAEYNVKRLRNHPSIALWCGNNENLRAWFDWGWNKKYTPKDSEDLWETYKKIFYQILPQAVSKFHPEISYWASSPQAAGNKLSDKISGDEHDWSVWFGDAPFSNYAVNVARFVSEYGLQSYPEMKTIHSFANNTDLSFNSSVMQHRQRSNIMVNGENLNGNEVMRNYISRYYNLPESFESFVYLSQLMQAEGVKYAIESHRRNMPNCMGSLYWQINDCWPTMSWASVDYFGRWKALHYAVKNAFQQVYPIIYRENGKIQVSVVNDRLISNKAEIISTLYDFNGKVLWQQKQTTALATNTSKLYASIPEAELLAKGEATQMFLEVDVVVDKQSVSNNLFYLVDPKNLKLEKPEISKTITKIGPDEYEIMLTSNTLVKNIGLSTLQSEGRFSDNYFDVIAGKTYKIKFWGKAIDFVNDIQILCLNCMQ